MMGTNDETVNGKICGGEARKDKKKTPPVCPILHDSARVAHIRKKLV